MRFGKHINDSAAEVWQLAIQIELEEIVAKEASSIYTAVRRGGRRSKQKSEPSGKSNAVQLSDTMRTRSKTKGVHQKQSGSHKARGKFDTREQTEATVLVMVAAAAQACRTKQMARLMDCLRNAVEVYEQHPLHAQHESSQLRALLTFIRSAQSLAKTLAIADGDVRELEARAEALRSPIH